MKEAVFFQAVEQPEGILPEAAQNYLNRARSLTDGQQIYVPTEEEIAENLEALASKVPEALQSGASEDTWQRRKFRRQLGRRGWK